MHGQKITFPFTIAPLHEEPMAEHGSNPLFRAPGPWANLQSVSAAIVQLIEKASKSFNSPFMPLSQITSDCAEPGHRASSLTYCHQATAPVTRDPLPRLHPKATNTKLSRTIMLHIQQSLWREQERFSYFEKNNLLEERVPIFGCLVGKRRCTGQMTFQRREPARRREAMYKGHGAEVEEGRRDRRLLGGDDDAYSVVTLLADGGEDAISQGD